MPGGTDEELLDEFVNECVVGRCIWRNAASNGGLDHEFYKCPFVNWFVVSFGEVINYSVVINKRSTDPVRREK